MTAVDLDALDAARAAALTIRQSYPSLPTLVQTGSDVEAVWSDGAEVTWVECEDAPDAALIVAAVNALPDLIAAARERDALRDAVLGRRVTADDPRPAGEPYSDGTTLWGPLCDCGSPWYVHRHGVSSNTSLANAPSEPDEP